MKDKTPPKKCYNCKYASRPFQIAGITHHQCQHPRHDDEMRSGAISPWDTLQKFGNTCEFHEFKEHKTTEHENQNPT